MTLEALGTKVVIGFWKMGEMMTQSFKAFDTN